MEFNNLENPIEPEVYKPLNDYENIKLNKNNTDSEEKPEIKIAKKRNLLKKNY